MLVVRVRAVAQVVTTVLVLTAVYPSPGQLSGQSSGQSGGGQRRDDVLRLLNTPVQQLDDGDIWEVASYLTNYSSLNDNDDVSKLDSIYDREMLDFMTGSGVPETQVPSQATWVIPVKPKDSQPERMAWQRLDTSHARQPKKSILIRTKPSQHPQLDRDPSGLAQHHRGAQHRPAPRSARDRFYFLHHLRPDLPALDQVLAEEPPASEEPEVSSTPEPPPPRPLPAVSEDQRLQTLLRAMVVYGEAAEGDEGTLSAVKKLAAEGVGRVALPSPSKRLAELIEDRSISKTRRRRGALRPDMARFADFMGREEYSQELINSFQPGSKRHSSIKKELREPIDVDMQSVALMAASLRKRSAPVREVQPAAEEKLPTAEVDNLGADFSDRARRSLSDAATAIYSASLQYGAATYSGLRGGVRARRRRRSAGGTRRVLDQIRIEPDLPDLMDLDPEDVLESEQSPLLPVRVSSGRDDDPFEVTERAALVFEESDRRETWSAWGRWGPCSVTCGPGQKARYRHCVQGPRCQTGERESDFKPCFRKSCSLPVPGGLIDAF